MEKGNFIKVKFYSNSYGVYFELLGYNLMSG